MIIPCLLALVTLGEVFAGGVEHAYLIKPRKVDSASEALSMLRRFIPPKTKFDDKCQRYAVLLKKMAKEPQDQFSIAELGLINMNAINNQYKEIDVETLRQLYVDTISKSLRGHLDSSMIDLLDCLVTKFRSQDAKARAFLNGRELRETVDQYKSIMSQPLSFLNDDHSKHPTLTIDQLQPAIRETLLDLFNKDASKVEARFPRHPEPVVEVTTPIMVVHEPIVEARTSANAGGHHPQAQAEADIRPSESRADQANGWLEAHDELSEEEMEYLRKMIDSLRLLYSSLPLESSLNHRCQAYSRIIDANPAALGVRLLDQVVHETAQQVTGQKGAPGRFVPEKDTRENFLVALNAFAPEQRDATWIDIIDCVSEWEQEDEDVKNYLNSPELSAVINDMLKNVEGNGQQA